MLADVDSPWADRLRDALHEQWLVAARGLEAASRVAIGDPKGATAVVAEAVAASPYRESAYRQLMRAQAAAGNRAEALRVYERCRRLLAEELAYPRPPTPRRSSSTSSPPTWSAPHVAGALPEDGEPGVMSTLTFLFTDIERSSTLWERQPESMALRWPATL